jgi:hypothetical protein
MGIDIGRLEDQLMQMSTEGAPEQEFCEAISELARFGHFEQLRGCFLGSCMTSCGHAISRMRRHLAVDGGGWRRI